MCCLLRFPLTHTRPERTFSEMFMRGRRTTQGIKYFVDILKTDQCDVVEIAS